MAYGYVRAPRRKRRRSTYIPRSIGHYRGRGSYASELGRNLLIGGGGALGALAGAPGGLTSGFGYAAGSAAGSKLSEMLGLGAYSVKANSLVHSVDEGQQLPAFGDLSDAVIIKHREYLADVVVPAVPAAFTNVQFVINPGSPATFPWLSTIASSFDSYMLLGMIFEFRSTSADIGSTSSLGMGTVIMGTDYDAHDAPPVSKVQMENMQYSCSAKPSESFCHTIECDPSVNVQPHLFVRTGAVATTEDSRFYDHGNFNIATQGLPTGSSGTLGELWCSYQVAFFKPQLQQGNALLTDFFNSSTATNTSFWGSNAVRTTNSSLGCSVVNNVLFLPGAGSFPPQPSKIGTAYWISYACLGNSTTFSTTVSMTSVDCTVNLLDLQSPAVTGFRQWFNCKVFVTGANPSITITGGTLPGSPVDCNLLVTQIDTDVFPDIV